jgi:ABC-type glycerol-3-phosphate transport system substrate-binding protein
MQRETTQVSDTTTEPPRDTALSRRRLLAGGAALAGAAAVGSLLPGTADARPFITQKRTSITFWTWGWITALKGVKGDPAKAAFEKSNPNVSLNVKLFPYADYLTALKTAVPAGTAGEVIAIPTLAVGHQYARYLEPLDALARKDLNKGWQTKHFPGVVDAVRSWDKQKRLLGLPVWSSVGGTMWYSKKLFAQAGVSVPTTYAELKDAAAKLKTAGIIPIAWGAKDGWPNPDFMIVYASQFQKGIIAAAEEGKASFTDPPIVKALEFMAQSIKDGLYNDAPFATTAFPESYVNDFDAGKAAMVMAGTWYLGLALSTPGAQDDWGAFLYPQIPGAPTTSWLNGRPSGVPADSGTSVSRPWATVNVSNAMRAGLKPDKAKAAWEFLMNQSSRQGEQINVGWATPSRSDVKLEGITSPEFSKMLKWHNTLGNSAERRDFLYSDTIDALQTACAAACVNGTDAKSALALVDAAAKRARARDKA